MLIQGGSPHLSGVPVNIHQIPNTDPRLRAWVHPSRVDTIILEDIRVVAEMFRREWTVPMAPRPVYSYTFAQWLRDTAQEGN